MTKDGVIVDTSVLIDFLKGTEPCAGMVSRLLEKNHVVTTGLIIAELLQGMKNLKEEKFIAELFLSLTVLEVGTV
ncbi:MAG: PIN domain-containing protein [Nitrospirae bacterium]|nr:PIN domain-containing protein [Nitrospirota bacterium]